MGPLKRRKNKKKNPATTMMMKNGTLPLEVADNMMAPKIQIIDEIIEEEVAVVEATTVVDIRKTVREEREKLMRTETQLRAKEKNGTEKKDHIPEEMVKEVEEREAVAAEEEVAVADITKTVREDHMMVRKRSIESKTPMVLQPQVHH